MEPSHGKTQLCPHLDPQLLPNPLPQLFKPAAPFAAVLALSAAAGAPVWWDVWSSSFLFLCCMSQQFHAWSHMKRSELPPAVVALQVGPAATAGWLTLGCGSCGLWCSCVCGVWMQLRAWYSAAHGIGWQQTAQPLFSCVCLWRLVFAISLDAVYQVWGAGMAGS
jgi:hypothetical protein